VWAAGVLLALATAAGLLAYPRIQAWYHLRAARAAVAAYHNPQAIRHLQACLRVWPDDPEVLLLTARAARRARAYGDAERALQKYQQVRGLDAACSFEQLLLSAERTVDQVADVCWRHIQQGHPDEPLILEALARGYLRQYRLPEARGCLERWLKIQSDNPQALCLQGQFRLDYQRAPAEAVESYRHAVRIDPEHEEARLGLAVALLESKNFAEAVEHLQSLRQSQPDNLRVRVGLAECRDALGEGALALRLVDEVLAEEPEYPPALSLRGRLALQDGRPVEAEAWLRRAVAHNPADHQARYSLIVCLNQNGKEGEAQEHKQWLTRREEDLKRFNEVITRDIVQRPNDPAVHYTLGQLLLHSGYREEGLRWLHSALRLDPQYGPARQALAEYARQAGGVPPPKD
jgi:tetratricopeptide (TPR) repeat protein